jgi:hypothetical protein
VHRHSVNHASRASSPAVVVAKVRHSRLSAPAHQPRTGHHRRFVDVEPGDPLVHHFRSIYRLHTCADGMGASHKQNLTNVLQGANALQRQLAVFKAPPVQLAIGLSSTMERRPPADGTNNFTPCQRGRFHSAQVRRQAGVELAMTMSLPFQR